MAGSRSVGTIDGTPTYINVSVRLIDSRGDLRTVTMRADPAVLDATVETLVAALQLATNASIYAVNVTQAYASLPLASLADDAVFESLFDNIAINFKDVGIGAQQTLYIPAPVGALILDGDAVDVNNALYTNVRVAYDGVLESGFNALSVRFTERREKNDSVPAIP